MSDVLVDGFSDAYEAPEVSKEELTLVTEILHAIVKTSKGFRMYLPNNPLLVKFIEELKSKLALHLSYHDDLRLAIDQFELRYMGKAVYQNTDPKESMAFKLYSDGIRFLILSEGIDEYELCEFLEIVGKERPGDVDDDIVTLLWEKNLPHLTYILAEDFLEFDMAGSAPTAPRSQQDKIRGIYSTISTTDIPPAPMLISQNILTLTDEETAWLRKNREAEEERKPLDEVIQIISSILMGEKDPEMFGEFVDIMARLAENLAGVGEMSYALSLIRFLGNLAKNENIAPANRSVADNAMGIIASERTMAALAKTIDTTELVTPEELLGILHAFGKSSIGRICEFLGLVEKMKMRKIIIRALFEIGHDAPEVFFPFLTDRRWYLVRNVIFILTRIGSPAALDHVVRLISHKEPGIRREVLNYLERAPDAKAKTYILKFLRDESSAIRVRALQVLTSTKSTFALKSITAIAASEQFAEKDMVEKKAVFEAIGELGSDQTLPVFRDMLMKKFWFNKAKEKESVICAVAGLAKMRSEGAVKLLEEARGVKSDEMREIIIQAIESIAVENRKSVTGS